VELQVLVFAPVLAIMAFLGKGCQSVTLD
jgi:hypothetical protein